MLAVITHPAGVAAGASANAGLSAALEDVILPSRQQTAAERMAVYSSAYFARLLEVLRELFPCLRFAVGDDLFDQFAVEYLQAHPPSSYTLHRLADQFADFLEFTRPQDDGVTAFVVDLARLEHAIDQVFDGPGPEATARQDAHPVFGSSTPRPVAGFRLLAFCFPVSSYFTAWKAGQKPAWPQAQEQFVALIRRDYVVRRFELLAVQFQLLSRLDAGDSLEQSLAAIAGQAASIDQLAAEVEGWFTFWSAEGFFAAAT